MLAIFKFILVYFPVASLGT